jgi:hypothetical protein
MGGARYGGFAMKIAPGPYDSARFLHDHGRDENGISRLFGAPGVLPGASRRGTPAHLCGPPGHQAPGRVSGRAIHAGRPPVPILSRLGQDGTAQVQAGRVQPRDGARLEVLPPQPGCKQVCGKGSHYEKMARLIEGLKGWLS